MLHSLLLLLLPLLLMLLLPLLLLSGAASSLRLGVVVQDGLVNESVVSRAVDRLVNHNWRLPEFQRQPLTFDFVQVSDSQVTMAMRKLCESGPFHGLIGVGACGLAASLHAMGASLRLPSVAVTSEMCDIDTDDRPTSLFATDHPITHLEAAAAALKYQRADTVAIFYDERQPHRLIEFFQNLLSKQQIASVTFEFDASSDTNVTDILRNSVKGSIHFCAVFARSLNSLHLLQQAAVTQTLQVNYFWIVMDTGLSVSDLSEVVPQNVTSNIVLVRSSCLQFHYGSSCAEKVEAAFGDCDPTGRRAVEYRTVDTIMAFAEVLANFTNSSGGADGAACGFGQAWEIGNQVAEQMKQMMMDEVSVELIGSFGEGDSLRFVESGRYKFNLTVTADETVFPNTFRQFNNRHLRICAPPFPPYTTYANTSYSNPSGHSVDMLSYMSRNLNFTFQVLSPSDLQFGGPVGNSSIFSGCIGEVQRGAVDFAMLFAITQVRDQVIDFSEEYLFSANSILVKKPPADSKLWNAFAPLSWEIWLILIGGMFVTAVVVYLLAKFSPFSAWNLGLSYAIADEVWLQEYMWSSVGSFLQQGQDFYPFAMSPRVAMAFWWILTVVIFGTYTGDLTAHLAVSTTEYPINSLQDLVDNTHYTAVVPNGTNLHTAILEATEGQLFLLQSRITVVDTMWACVETLLTSDNSYLVCISDHNSNLYFANQYCDQVYNAEESFNFYYLAMAFPIDAYYLPAFDYLLQRAKEDGVSDALRQKYFPSSNDCSEDSLAAEAETIGLESVSGICLVTGVLYCVGACLLAAELLWTRAMHREPLDCIIF